MHFSPIVLGTAGHIDHGKTSLVKALTGIDTDRLKHEKQRGITTELGFAYFDVGDHRISVVDVPGHERFIKAMTAGIVGIDIVCLVVAADEGMMPQTREHMDICSLLGVETGVIAVTKADLVEPDWLALVEEEIAKKRATTFLRKAKIIPVSTKTGEGLPALRTELENLARAAIPRHHDGPFRLPIDRVFSQRGFGTVVTGTVSSGTAQVGDTVAVSPGPHTAKIRGLQFHGRAIDTAFAGMRCAANLAGIPTQAVTRGQTLAHPHAISPTHSFDVRFHYLPTSKHPLNIRSKILLHHGATQSLATLVLAATQPQPPGSTCFAQLRLDANQPICAIPGDRFIVRGFAAQEHYGTTIGGGKILRIHAPRLRSTTLANTITTLEKMEGATPIQRIPIAVQHAGLAGIFPESLHARLGFAPNRITELLGTLCRDQELVAIPKGTDSPLYVHKIPWNTAKQQLLQQIQQLQASAPANGISREELRSKRPTSCSVYVLDALLHALHRCGAITITGDTVYLRTSVPEQDLSPLEQTIVRKFENWKVTPPNFKEFPTIFACAPQVIQTALQKLVKTHHLARVKFDYYIHKQTLDDLQTKLTQHLRDRGQITPSEWKTITQASRKFTIPLAEYFDQIKLTLRVGDIRKLRSS